MTDEKGTAPAGTAPKPNNTNAASEDTPDIRLSRATYAAYRVHLAKNPLTVEDSARLSANIEIAVRALEMLHATPTVPVIVPTPVEPAADLPVEALDAPAYRSDRPPSADDANELELDTAEASS